MGREEVKSFWLEHVEDKKPYEKLQKNLQVDVCIIGGGFTGLSTAIHLKEKNPSMRVVLLESKTIGHGASGRNAGFSMRLFGVSLEITRLRHGKKSSKEANEYMIDAVNYLESMIKKYEIDCDYKKEGMLTVASNKKELKNLRKEMKLAVDLGFEGLRWLDQEETRKYVNSPRYLAAIYDEHCALLNPAKLVGSLAKVAKNLGVEIYENSKVEDIDEERTIAKAKDYQVEAEKIVFATNAYSSFYPDLDRRQIPIYTYITLTEPLSEKQLQALHWDRRVGIEDARNFLHYYRLTPDNRLLLGGSEALYYYGSPLDQDKNEKMNDILQRDLLKIFPQLKGIEFTHHWGGPISATLDFIPSIGYINDNILYSMGCMGHGVSLTNYNGLTLAEILLGEETKRTEMFFVGRKVLPIPREPIRYVTISAIRSLLRFEDRLGGE